MEITVRFTGNLRALAGHSSMVLEAREGTTIREALVALRGEVEPAFDEQVLQPFVRGEPPLVLLLVNRIHLSGAAELDRPLGRGDIIAFAMPMEGG
jgi:molybdopterin converting factor small subunit